MIVRIPGPGKKPLRVEIAGGWHVVYYGNVHYGDKCYDTQTNGFVEIPQQSVGQPVTNYTLVIRKPFPGR